MMKNRHQRLRPETKACRCGGDALRWFAKAFDTMQLGVTIADTEGRIVYTNPAEARMHGYSVEELIGEDIGIFAGPEKRIRLTRDDLSQLRSWGRERRHVRKDGSVFPVQLLSDVVRNADGEPIGIITTCEDISERELVQEELWKAHEELDKERRALEAQLRHAQKMEAVGRLTGGIAHDFNNILSIILASAEMIAAAHPGERSDLVEHLRDIQAAAQRGANMTRELLGFSRQADVHMVPTDLREVVTDLTGLLRHLIRADIEIETLADERVGTVCVDLAAVQQMLMNLVTNARDAMPGGGTVHVAVTQCRVNGTHETSHPQLVPGEYVCLSVTDNGVGMDEQTKARIFEPFFTTKPLGKGTGLGLAMIYGLVERHGGHVDVASEKGKGTTVTLYFPVVQ